ncbi:dUTP diphosphatase [Halioxenophilus sp. WMMB6]|uniref:dUTP diphosphatase n=1 Tax=Halioxenophilus sp. WMMB6 TaxID=3073815 RepID=UPI00295EB83A|nr:dUTP diphosphatase [Halioxenophilus sp. WMMB6]
MKQQLADMLALQEEINRQVHPNWREQNFEWHRAIWIESAELLDHYGWKWWKKHSPDLGQVQLELVDIWHFALSMALQEHQSPDSVVTQLAEDLVPVANSGAGFAEVLEQFVAKIVGDKQFDVSLFSQLLNFAELSFSDLYEMYIAKNILNRFRQDHGYKEGTYIKQWQDREDNEHLAELLDTFKQSGFELGETSFFDWLYGQLQSRYPG